MAVDLSTPQAILAAARANPNIAWGMGVPINKQTGMIDTEAHVAGQYLDYASKGYGTTPDWNTALAQAQSLTMQDIFNGGKPSGDYFTNTPNPTQNPVIPTTPPPAGGPKAGDGRSNPPAPVLNGSILQPASMTYTPRGTYSGIPQAMPKQGGVVTPPASGGLLGTAPQQMSGSAWNAGANSNFSGSYMPAFAPRGVANYQYPSTPGGAVARTQGSGLPPLTTPPAPGNGSGTPVSPEEEKRAKALQSGALYQPRQFANYQDAGVTMPYRNQYEQYALSAVQGQPWMPTFGYQNKFNGAAPVLQQKLMGLLGGGNGGGGGNNG